MGGLITPRALQVGPLGSHCQPIPDNPRPWHWAGPNGFSPEWTLVSRQRSRAWPGQAVTVALLPRMDCRRPSCWAWILLATALMAGGAACIGATVSGVCGPSPGWAGVGGLCGRCGTHVWGCRELSQSPPPLPGTCVTSQPAWPLSCGLWPPRSPCRMGAEGLNASWVRLVNGSCPAGPMPGPGQKKSGRLGVPSGPAQTPGPQVPSSPWESPSEPP